MFPVAVPVDLPPLYLSAPCVERAAGRYAVPELLLLALRSTEAGRPGQAVRNRNGTFDYGPYQINTLWAAKFAASQGIPVQRLRDDECLGAQAAAYIVRTNLNAVCKTNPCSNGDFWRAVGRYRSKTPSIGWPYALHVKRTADAIHARLARKEGVK